MSSTAVLSSSDYLGWYDEGTGTWKNAVLGNSMGTAQFNLGAYIPGTMSALGNYGVDTTGGVVWAVVNHNSEFAVVPEPAALSLLALGGLALLRRRRVKD